MKLLIVTQVVDKEHPILGFFHRWVEEFAKHCEHVHVICLEAGKHSLPANVTVHSLGKEEGNGKLTYLLRFYKLIWILRKDYDNVFVHMNHIYVVLGGLLWRLWGKKIGLWYMHKSVPTSLRLAEKITHKIFTGSSESFRLPSKKVLVTGHGIDTETFSPGGAEKTLDLITVGRVSESKNLVALVDVLKETRNNHDVTLTIVGGGVTEADKEYERILKEHIEELDLEKFVGFKGAVQQKDLPELLNQAKVFVTAANNGSLDKAVLEALACGLPVVSMAEGTKSIDTGVYQADNSMSFATMLNTVLESKEFHNSASVTLVIKKHSIVRLAKSIVSS